MNAHPQIRSVNAFGFVGKAAAAAAIALTISGFAFAGLSNAQVARRAVVTHPSHLHDPGLAAVGPVIARDLVRQAQVLSEAGDPAGALAASRKATAIYRVLAATNPSLYLPYLAASLHDLSVLLNEAGDDSGALSAIDEAIKIRRTPANEDLARYADLSE